MSVTVVVGGFYGDEGKGKIVAFHALSQKPAVAVRGGVGPNAGHTVVMDGVTRKTRLIPSAFVCSRTQLCVSAGVLVEPSLFISEVNELGVAGRAYLDSGAGVIEKKHIELDRTDRNLSSRIGTTGTGTGPAMSDRVLRQLKLAGEIAELRPYMADIAGKIHNAIEEGESVLLEGTQGTFLSLYHGSYPYVTSKDVTASSICADAGIGPTCVDHVLVVFKSYVTRVGNGPLANELRQEEVENKGWTERGSVTGRLRRAAPFNIELAKRSVRLNGATMCALTKLDAIFPEASGMREYGKLPRESRAYIEELEEALGVPIVYVGTGSEVKDTVVVPH